MGTTSSNSLDVTQDVMNNFVQESRESCISSTNCQANNNVIVVSGSVAGNVGIVESCTANSRCMMNNSMDTSITNILASMTNQKNTAITDLFGDFSFNSQTNSVNIRQTIQNFVTQITESTCQSTASLIANNNIVISNATVGGSVGVILGQGNDPAGTSQSSCTMTNITKLEAYNKEQSTNSQSNTSIGMIAIIAIIIGLVLIVGLVMVAIVAATGGLTGIIGAAKGKKGKEGFEGAQMDELIELEKSNPELFKAV